MDAMTLDYARNPLVLRDPTNEIVAGGGVVANRLVGHLGGAYGIPGFLEVRASLPVVIVENGNHQRSARGHRSAQR